MSTQKINPRTGILLMMIAVVGIIRIIINSNHDIAAVANFSPIGAMALFGGATFNKTWKAITFPLLALFISDLILHITVYSNTHGILYGGWYWVYSAFALMTLAGRMIMKTITVNRFLVSALACVFIHWTITDFGVWAGSKTFSQDVTG